MTCPLCRARTRCQDSRPTQHGRRRRYRCTACHHTFATLERLAAVTPGLGYILRADDSPDVALAVTYAVAALDDARERLLRLVPALDSAPPPSAPSPQASPATDPSPLSKR